MIHKAALVTVRDGSLLLCRKHGSETWILPGGKIEPGESALDALLRELAEELGDLQVRDVAFHAAYDSLTDQGMPIRLELFTGILVGEPTPRAEIAELRWHPINEPLADLAPSLRDQILPELRTGGDWSPPPP